MDATCQFFPPTSPVDLYTPTMQLPGPPFTWAVLCATTLAPALPLRLLFFTTYTHTHAPDVCVCLYLQCISFLCACVPPAYDTFTFYRLCLPHAFIAWREGGCHIVETLPQDPVPLPACLPCLPCCSHLYPCPIYYPLQCHHHIPTPYYPSPQMEEWVERGRMTFSPLPHLPFPHPPVSCCRVCCCPTHCSWCMQFCVPALPHIHTSPFPTLLPCVFPCCCCWSQDRDWFRPALLPTYLYLPSYPRPSPLPCVYSIIVCCHLPLPFFFPTCLGLCGSCPQTCALQDTFPQLGGGGHSACLPCEFQASPALPLLLPYTLHGGGTTALPCPSLPYLPPSYPSPPHAYVLW